MTQKDDLEASAKERFTALGILLKNDDISKNEALAVGQRITEQTGYTIKNFVTLTGNEHPSDNEPHTKPGGGGGGGGGGGS